MKKNVINIDSLVNSVGCEIFVKYFNEFKNLEKSELIILFDKDIPNWKNISKKQEANNGKRIFREKREFEALEHIILVKNENKIPNGVWVKKQAKLLLLEYKQITEEPKITENITFSEKQVLVNFRIQQSKFRRELINYWEGCSITNCKNVYLLIASHIKPYSLSTNKEKYDINNGLLLTPVYNTLFDKFLISFNESGEILISKSIEEQDLRTLNITGKEKIKPLKLTDKISKYLKYHLEEFEKRENK